ncbi:hypothetical protein CVT26_011675 [Gymnopilus dilepis]|uniref:Uncharacterized protein n=1 Tax=Gymnopilus dilepis TaxID=231916 RepID=A0A409WCD2_9AGAR|nr:hypothetical protein CVT26_011675 [Gymnopilus dilepis]
MPGEIQHHQLCDKKRDGQNQKNTPFTSQKRPQLDARNSMTPQPSQLPMNAENPDPKLMTKRGLAYA